MSDPKLRAQLRIAEIDGMLEDIHLDLTLRTSGFGSQVLLRMETDLRRERQSLCAELGDR